MVRLHLFPPLPRELHGDVSLLVKVVGCEPILGGSDSRTSPLLPLLPP